jgi:hypothetical protein
VKIVFLTNEVDLDAKGGGTQRSKMLIKSIEDSRPPDSNFSVLAVPFFEFQRMPESQVYDLPVSQDIEFGINLEVILQKHPKKLKSMIELLLKADFIFVDNCYFAPIIEHITNKSSSIPKIIYISHNYEARLKVTTSQLLAWPRDKASLYLKKVEEFENYLWRTSMYRIVCAIDDAVQLNKVCEKNFIHVANGGFKRNKPNLTEREVLDFLGCESYSLFVASGHPPNIDGFIEGIGPDFGFMPKNTRIVLVGSSVGPIEEKIKTTIFYETYLKKGSAIPNASDEMLDNLYAYARTVVLPIFRGSGTSIKSVEALLSDKHLIATHFALRGIDIEHLPEDRVDFCSTQIEFKKALQKRIRTAKSFSGVMDGIPSLEWTSIQNQAASEIKKLFQEKVTSR